MELTFANNGTCPSSPKPKMEFAGGRGKRGGVSCEDKRIGQRKVNKLIINQSINELMNSLIL